MTEEEAKTKHCCGPEGCGSREENKFGYPKPTASNSELLRYTIGSTMMPRMCIGSACTAWRKLKRRESQTSQVDNRTTWIETGYCGLAGAP